SQARAAHHDRVRRAAPELHRQLHRTGRWRVVSVSDLLVVGLSHQTAPVDVRERLALTPEVQEAELSRLSSEGVEAMWLSTCNRVEVYVAADDLERARELVRSRLLAHGGSGADAHLYEHHAESALVHLFRVSSSLESMVLGEPQILGQVK